MINIDYGFLSRSERFKKLQSDHQQNLLIADRTHLDPLPPYTPVEYAYSKDRDDRYLSRSTCSLAFVPDVPGYWYWRPVQIDKTLLDVRERCQARFLARKEELSSCGINLVLDISKNSYFWSVEPQSLPNLPHSLPTKTAKNAKKVSFLPVAQESRKTAKKFGLCNTQTIAGRPAKIDIKRSDFLAR